MEVEVPRWTTSGDVEVNVTAAGIHVQVRRGAHVALSIKRTFRR